MDAELTKSLVDLIDETMAELEDLRKSRFAAEEIKLEGPGAGIAGKPSDGKLDAQKAEDEEEEEEEGEEEGEEEDEDEAKKAEKDPEGDPADDPETKRKLKDLMEKEEKSEMKKSEEGFSTLMKSYVDERVQPIEAKLTEIFSLVEKIANQPVAPKGVMAKAVPLMKSADEGYTPLSKTDVASKLYDLKKSGTKVDSLDIVRADLGQDLEHIVKKYQIS